jgi:hypothetical protein
MSIWFVIDGHASLRLKRKTQNNVQPSCSLKTMASSLRLVNLTSFTLENFDIKQLPAYLAISHVWSENLFPVSSPCDPRCEGLRMVTHYLNQQPQYLRPGYCWTDTWCIDQSSSLDKELQIPLMGTVYRNALLVLIMLRHHFTFSQSDWDGLVFGDLGKAIPHWRGEERYSKEAFSCYRSPETVASLHHGIEMLKEIAGVPWMQRIWTAQEYILAREDVWIGGDYRSLRMAPQYIIAILEIMCRFELAAKRLILIKEFDSMMTLLQLRLETLDPTFAIGLARERQSTFKRDESYGLMNASRVVISTTFDTVEKAWEAWWESALRNGHIVWAMQLVRCANCVMPSYETRCDSILDSNITSDTTSTGSTEVYDGSISIMGRNAGQCTIDMSLGLSKRGQAKNFLNAVVTATSGDLNIISQLYAAMTTGRFTRAQLAAKAA